MTARLLLFMLLMTVTGCLRTRHIDVSSVTTCDCYGANHDAVYNERNWCGFWLGHPARFQP
jgi:hypothetical protein